jgi:ERF superfamily
MKTGQVEVVEEPADVTPLPIARMGFGQPPGPPISEGMALVHMIERVARDPSIDIGRLKELLAMKREMLDREAQMAFDAAFAEMQPELPVIDQKGLHGGTNSTYAKWEDIIEAITPILGAHGFSFRCRIKQEGAKVSITGKLSHRDGFFEETTIELPVDATGQKNAVQAIGSSIFYGQRYVIKAMLSLSSRKSDDDNGDAGGGTEFITPKQLEDLIDLIEDVGVPKELICRQARIDGLAHLRADRLETVITKLNLTKTMRANRK